MPTSARRRPAPISRLAPLVLLLLLLVVCVPSAGAWTWPVAGPVLQGLSFDHAHPYAAGQHRGIDIGATAGGVAVLAPAAGIVTFAGAVPTSGESVTIETPAGLSVTLTHLGSIAVSRNDDVAEGAVVGSVGPSGTPEVEGPYVHLGIRTTADDQGYLDPLGLLPVAGPPAQAPVPAAPPAPVAAPAPQPAPVASSAPAAAPVATASPASVPAAAASAAATQPSAPGAASAPVESAAGKPTAHEPSEAGGTPSADALRAALSSADTVPAAVPSPGMPAAVTPVASTATPGLLVVGRAPASRRDVRKAPAPAASAGFLPSAFVGAVARPAVSHGIPTTRRATGRATGLVARGAHAPAPASAPGDPAAPRPAEVAARAFAPRPAAVLRTHARRPLVSSVVALTGLALLALGGLAASGVAAVRMIRSPSPTSEGARPVAVVSEDPRRAGMAVREWAAPHRTRGGLRRAGGRVRALSPAQGQRRLDGERNGRARHAGDGVRRQERRIAA
jgi:hypothetical protein